MTHSSVRGEGAPADAPDGIPGTGGTAAAVRPARERPASRKERPGTSGEGGGKGDGKGDGEDGAKGRRPPAGPRRRPRRILRWTAFALAFLILGTSGAGYLYYRHLNDGIQTDALNLGDSKLGGSRPNAFGQIPLNILLIGSDARDDQANQDLGGARETFGGTPLADVQMLLHVSADRTNMSVISMPRDTLLKLPKCTDTDGKVYEATQNYRLTNESLGRGGPGCTVATWQELTGIPIDHFMMIDFKGVVSMADAIGGVPVCVTDNVFSRDSQGHGSGLKLTKGENVIQGVQALQWLRTRYGFEDGTDLARTHAQHMYMNSMAREFRKNANLRNPLKLHSLAEAAIDAMVVDTGLNRIDKLFDLSMELKKVPTGRITMTTMPWVYSNRLAGKVEPKEGDAQKLFAMVRDDIPLDGKGSSTTPASPGATPAASASAATSDPAAPADRIPVMVRNATGGKQGAGMVEGRATAVTALLTGKGFTAARADSQTAGEDTTVIRYAGLDQAGDALAVATALGLPATAVQRSTDVSGVTLFVGKDWPSGDKPGAPAPGATASGTAVAPRPGDKAPDSARPLNGDDSGACMEVQKGFTW
ncbi:LCP family protein [Streptomyces bambusae]|uniref:LCP family protein n=1 Tax=Streptomyces bambusae TaxID=1550616 RepID=UPI001CFF1187|nr:LCP family protein [Streptomyces bambusae]MCB5166320.1 LCP family protein [Streptomyces bambusae]